MSKQFVKPPADRCDSDSIHILPLVSIPIQTRILKTARLVKNARLEGTIELFNDCNRGSAQILPEDLPKYFEGGGHKEDFALISALCALPSYDVYSLRLELRKLGISVNDNKYLCLSPAKSANLAKYMNAFTRPLIARVYGDSSHQDGSFKDLLGLFLNPDRGMAHNNLADLARALGINKGEIPNFLERYADTYLALANYSAILDSLSPPLVDFAVVLQQIQADRHYIGSPGVLRACRRIEDSMMTVEGTTGRIISLFEAHTKDMWDDVSATRYRQIEQLIQEYQRSIAANLCALAVKMDAWRALSGKRSLAKCVQFIMSEMAAGVDALPPLSKLPLKAPWQKEQPDWEIDADIEWIA